ncbi:hypothetical protein ES703_82276 [subsurface metagenome]
MDEAYTCICGGQAFSIHDGGEIRCGKCLKEYQLQWLDENFNHEFESPKDFNERVRKE